jgi:outer membrane protein, heavy metal efflux system
MRTRLMVPILGVICAGLPACAQTALTWEQVKARFETANPTLRAWQLNISESKTQEITAYLRPNPSMSVSVDQFEPFSGNPYRPFGSLLPFVSFDYLHERQHKRELRLESAQKGTAIAESQQLDLERTMLFTLHNAFVQTLQAKRLLEQA